MQAEELLRRRLPKCSVDDVGSGDGPRVDVMGANLAACSVAMLVHANGPYDDNPKVISSLAVHTLHSHASLLYLATDRQHERGGFASLLVKWSVLAAQASKKDYLLVSAGNDVSTFWQKRGFCKLADSDTARWPEITNAVHELSSKFGHSSVLICPGVSHADAMAVFTLACERLGACKAAESPAAQQQGEQQRG